MFRFLFAVAISSLLLIAAGAEPAFAHASLSPGSVPGNSDQQLTMDVAHERGDTVHNTNI